MHDRARRLKRRGRRNPRVAARLVPPSAPPAPPPQDPLQSAKAAGLRYVTDAAPGIRRRKAGKGFSYLDAEGKPVRDRETLRRIRGLAIPPAWTEVWISPDPRGHLQATGRDVRGRKQYRYHPEWRRTRDDAKYSRMIAFAQALPAIRARVEEDKKRPGLPREKVLATIVDLLGRTFIRVGNEAYAKTNRSYGLTTLRNQHVEVDGATLRFRFRGKSGKAQKVALEDPRIARIVKRCQDLPGQELFQWVDDEGNERPVTSQDVNEYLRDVTGQDFTAKDFRTWAGTVLAAMALQELEASGTKAQAKKNVVRAIEQVAQRLGNTPAVCRKCYVHPAILDSYLDGTLAAALRRRVRRAREETGHDLRPEEAAVLALLSRRLAAEEKAGGDVALKLERSVARARKARGPARRPRR